MNAYDTAKFFMDIIDGYYGKKISLDDTKRLLAKVLDELLSRLEQCESDKKKSWLSGFFNCLMFENPEEADYPKVREYADEYVKTFINFANKTKINVKNEICNSIDSIMTGKFARAINKKSHYIRDGLCSPFLTYSLLFNSLHAGWVFGPVVGIICSTIAALGLIFIPMVEIGAKKYQYEKLCKQKNAISNSVDRYRNPEAAAFSQEQPTPENLPVKEQLQQAQNKQNEINESDVSKVGDKITEKNDER